MHPKAKTILEEITSGHKKKEDIDPAHHTLEDVEDFINYDLTHDDDEAQCSKIRKSAISKVQKSIICIFKNGKKSIFAPEKSPKIAFLLVLNFFLLLKLIFCHF